MEDSNKTNEQQLSEEEKRKQAARSWLAEFIKAVQTAKPSDGKQ